MKLSPGVEFLISRQGIQPHKTVFKTDLIDAPLSPCPSGGRVITINGSTVQVVRMPPKRKEPR